MSQLKDALQPRVRRKFSQPNRVIVFTRHPEAGVTKTRLIPALGPELASRVQTELTKRTLDVAQRHCAGKPCDVEVRFAGGDRLHMERQFGLDKRYRRQGEGDLGARLAGVFETAFAEGAQRVLVTGADCPGLKPSILNTAIEALSEADVVLGPAFDGGYYLVGLHSPNPSLFAGIDWGTGQVLTQTIQRATAAGLSVNLLQKLSDVDYPEDLIALRRRADDFGDLLPRTRTGLLSVIVPTLNEAPNLNITKRRPSR